MEVAPFAVSVRLKGRVGGSVSATFWFTANVLLARSKTRLPSSVSPAVSMRLAGDRAVRSVEAFMEYHRFAAGRFTPRHLGKEHPSLLGHYGSALSYRLQVLIRPSPDVKHLWARRSRL